METTKTVTDAEDFAFSANLMAVVNPTAVQAEALRALRTFVQAQHISLGRRALAICSPNLDSGTSFIAANLAASLALTGVRTLLVDCDLRRPSLESFIRPSGRVAGVTDCLTEETPVFAPNIRSNVLPNLSVMYAGRPAANPQELIAGDGFKKLMAYCMREYAITIVDTPAANLSSDARRISAILGYSLIVVGQDKSYLRDVNILASQLKSDGAEVIGIVLNQG